MKEQIQELIERYDKDVTNCNAGIDSIKRNADERDEAEYAALLAERRAYRQIITDLETILKSEQK